jgi:hypothetical protein
VSCWYSEYKASPNDWKPLSDYDTEATARYDYTLLQQLKTTKGYDYRICNPQGKVVQTTEGKVFIRTKR